MDISRLENGTETLRAIAHPIRIAIIELLNCEDRMSVTEIYEKLKIEQAIASHHLRILKSKNIVKVSRKGKNSFYFLADQGFADMVAILNSII